MQIVSGRRQQDRPGAASALSVAAASAALLIGTGVAVAGVAPAALASTTTVLHVTKSGSATGPCGQSEPCNSLARAITVADHVSFATPVEIFVGGGTFVTHVTLPDRSYPESNITIEGAGAATVLSGGGGAPVLVTYSDAPELTIESLEFTDADNGSAVGGGALHDGGNAMTLDSVIFDGNTAHGSALTGGAVDDDGGVMTVEASKFSGNSAVASSTVAPASGGAIAEQGGTLTIETSLFTGNAVKVAGQGGAVSAEGGKLSISDSTFTGNSATATATGGVIGLDSTTSATVVGSTINGNTAAGVGGLVAGTGGSAIGFGGDILEADAGSGGSTCASVTVHDLGYNVVTSPSCSFGGTTRVSTASKIGLQPLAGNGGPLETERLAAGSSAHDVVPNSVTMAGSKYCAGTDGRRFPRQQGPATHCDAGSYQFAPPVITSRSPTSGKPGTGITIDGYGFIDLTLKFGGSLARAYEYTATKLSVAAPSESSTTTVTITLSNPDGHASTTFKVVVS